MATQGETRDVKPALTPEVMAVIEAMSAANQKAMLEFAAELRKPTPEQEVALAEKREKAAKKKADEIEAVKTYIAREEGRRKSCSHTRDINGKSVHCWRGQVTSGDRMVHPVCANCQTEWPPFKANDEMLTNGAQLEAMKSLNSDMLSAWHKQSFPEGCGKRLCFVCNPKE